MITHIRLIFMTILILSNTIQAEEFKKASLNLTHQEQEYIKNKKELTVCVKKGWLPYEDLDDGKFVGISADFLNLYAQKLSIPLKIIVAENQLEVLELLKQKRCDIKPLMEKQAGTGLPYKSTKQQLEDNIVLVTKIDQPFISNLNTLDQTVAMEEGFVRFIKIIEKKYPKIKTKKVANIDTALKLVANGEIFGYVGTSLVSAYQIQKKYATQLKIVNDFDSLHLGVGVRDDDIVLLHILNKVISKTTNQEKQNILNNWLVTTVEKKQSHTFVWGILFVFLLILIIILYFLIQQKKLRKEIEELNHTLEDKILEATRDLNRAQSIAKIGFWQFCNLKNELVWSDETYNIFEINKEEEIIEKIEDFIKYIHPDDVSIVTTAFDNHVRFQKEYFIVHRIVTKKNNIKYVEERCESVFDNYGNPMKSDGTVQDVTERVLKEQAVDEKERQMLQQSKLAQMGEMISMIAHQWRQPLTAISARINNLLFKIMLGENISNELLEKELNKIGEYSQHLSSTIDDFRGFFKDNKKKELISISDAVNSTLAIIQISTENKGINIITDLQCTTKFETYANEIKQVILNLIKNAEDALLENNIKNPTITIQSICDINCNNPTLIIKDNAGGIPQEIKDKIFDPYFSTKFEKDGTGLGLYMSKTIIEEHCQGKLSVENDKDGAVFKIEFRILDNTAV
jgi:two-component system sensor histidine kinase EvgS